MNVRVAGPLGAALAACIPLGSVSAAAPTSAQPSVTTASYVQTEKLPVALLSGTWQSDSRVANQLTISGPSVTGVRSVADASWTSLWGWAKPGKVSLRVVVDVRHRAVLPGLAPSSWSYSVDMRVKGGGWITSATSIAQSYDPVITPEWIITDMATFRSRTLVQFRVTFHTNFSSTTDESISVAPRCFLDRK